MAKNALVLSGGGSRGGYEIGVWQALREMGIPIHIVTGTSVGALNGAMVAQDDFDLAVTLWKELETCMIFDVDAHEKGAGFFDFEFAGMNASEALAYAKEILLNGGAGTSGLEKIVAKYVNEEKIRASEVELGVVTVEFPSLKPHYLFTENVPCGKLTDYILASAACFPAVQAKEIDGIKFIDGGYNDVMPVELALQKDADRIIAVYLEAAGFVRRGTLETAEEMASEVTLIQSPWDLGNFLIFDTDNTRRIIRLGYLDTMKAFGLFSGQKYTFKKEDFTSHQLQGAESAAEIFKLDPCLIYGRQQLSHKLAQAAAQTEPPITDDIHRVEDALRKLNQATLVLYIAQELREKGASSIFTHRNAFRLLKHEISAANYLLREQVPLKGDSR